MYLKALEIQGFKSFPDKTVLNFGEDITAIVGPNGSGKSNVSDAIRWVMGEQSTKSLRGAKMEDVIFGGTAKRKQSNFAEVTLVLDNTNHIFPTMEEAEVSVTRRYSRSGESEYYINRQSVRLKDVTELFMDTGMGKEGYSIIGQGRIDEILSTRSKDRREIFEEAAGISKYRHRKEEAERKLQGTQDNLVRINDKIAELELQVEPLRDQAEKAKKYLVLRDEMRLLEISVWLSNLDDLKVNVRKLKADLEEAERLRDDAEKEMNALFAAGEEYGEKMRAKDIEAEGLRSEAAGLETQIAEHDAAVAVLDTTIAHQRETIAMARQELEERGDRAAGLQEQIAGHSRRIARIDEQVAELTAAQTELLRQAEEAAVQEGGAQTEAESLRGREAIAVAAAADARAEVSAATAERGQMAQRLETVEKDLVSAEEQLESARKDAKSNRRALEDAQDEVTAASNVIAGHNLRMEERRKKATAATDTRMALAMETGDLDNQIRLLEKLARDYEGFGRAVRMVMQAKGDLRGIHGPVGNLMKTDARFTVAVEIALGGGLQNIIVDREEDAKAAINYLKKRDGGRTTFLPMTAIRGEELKEPQLANEFGYVGLASQLVEYDERYTQIFRYMLGRTVIVEDMDCGIAIARKYGSRFRIVTLDGQVLNRGGSMTGGSSNVRDTGVLGRAAKLTELKATAEKKRAALETAARDEEVLKRELDAASYELNTAEAQLRAAEDEVLRLSGLKEHYDILLTGLQDALENLEGERNALQGRIADTAERIRTAEELAAARDTEAAGYRAAAEEILSGQSELRERSGVLAEDIAARKAELAALGAEKEAVQQSVESLQAVLEQLAGDREEKARQAEACEAGIVAAEREIAEHRAVTDELQKQTDALRSRLNAINEEKLALEAERTASVRAAQDMNATLMNLQNTASRLEQKVSTSAMEEKQILDRLWDTYELNHTDAQAQRMELESVPKASRRIGELKRAIHALGTPNLGAIEEFERVNTRYTYLSEQRDDVEKAKADLEGVIEEITRQMTDIFSVQFKLLTESFETTFTDLFGGGHATLELEDKNDILGCGIEIKAQPPGKSLKTISLLSGGEKAFVAIALYFAILKVHPTPFCVMDEIEAALDEANVVRYARYMRRLAGKTQFIVITHRRGTMEESDVLYGVTMQERGVTKVLTINMNDIARQEGIK